MLAAEIRTDPHNSPARQAEPLEAESSVTTVKVYTRHNRGCSKREQSDWARCNCMKWLYIYRDGKYKLVSAKTRSWERAEQKAREVRDAFDLIRQLQRRRADLKRNRRRTSRKSTLQLQLSNSSKK
jgi:hypothetical protein